MNLRKYNEFLKGENEKLKDKCKNFEERHKADLDFITYQKDEILRLNNLSIKSQDDYTKLKNGIISVISKLGG